MNLDELRAQAKATRAAAPAPLTDDETEMAKLLSEIAEGEAEAQAINKARREMRGKALEVEASRAALAGKYLVTFFDLGELLPKADPSLLPGGGVLVLRSPPAGAVATFHRELEAKAKSIPEIYTDLVCVSTVYPDLTDDATGAGFRAFFESSLGTGASTRVGDAVTDLGGIRIKATKRGRG